MYNVLTPLSNITFFFCGPWAPVSLNSPTAYERYAPYLARAGASFLGLARAINAGLLDMDGPLLTAFIDRWRPETHSFHLPCGEMSVLMEDVAYILGLRLDGPAVTCTINTDN